MLERRGASAGRGLIGSSPGQPARANRAERRLSARGHRKKLSIARRNRRLAAESSGALTRPARVGRTSHSDNSAQEQEEQGLAPSGCPMAPRELLMLGLGLLVLFWATGCLGQTTPHGQPTTQHQPPPTQPKQNADRPVNICRSRFRKREFDHHYKITIIRNFTKIDEGREKELSFQPSAHQTI